MLDKLQVIPKLPALDLDPTKNYLVRFAADNAATRVVINLSYYYRPGA